MRIAVIGSGPAGLLAAHTAWQCGASDVQIFSNGGKSVLYGAQYLHAPIPGITAPEPQAAVNYQLVGTALAYRTKVYGDTWEGHVSPDEYGREEAHAAWDIRFAYAKLWDKYRHLMQQVRCDAAWLEHNRNAFDRIFWTAPATHLCQQRKQHYFDSQLIFASGDAPALGQRVATYGCPPNTILCSGRSVDRWYRVSNILGYVTAEYPLNAVPPAMAVKVRKPLATNCNCWPVVLRLGRYGTWRKGYLVHEVAADVWKAMQ
jgi:hypothetical protein